MVADKERFVVCDLGVFFWNTRFNETSIVLRERKFDLSGVQQCRCCESLPDAGTCVGYRIGRYSEILFWMSSGTVTVNSDSSMQVLAEEAATLDQLDVHAVKEGLTRAQAELLSAQTDASKAEAQIAVEVYEELAHRSDRRLRSEGLLPFIWTLSFAHQLGFNENTNLIPAESPVYAILQLKDSRT
ncbi:F-type H+-transporting ATPase subunit delta [Clonorchis sinensis]|uniref:F-type H+-transporting ATPase subunit delta n=1 Tax=Clonorchis sinensis TaxID=79923 RepID=G7Y8E4_CLOSI|nr:F-type H+-transporting ATPase subunit delta [Clonorchis sinensis]